MLVLGLLAGAAGGAWLQEGVIGLGDGLQGSVSLLWSALPFVVVGIMPASMIQVLVPPSRVGKWMGDDTGKRGLLVGMLAGGADAAWPLRHPVAAALLNRGAGVGSLAGFFATWNLVALNREVVWEIPFLGAPFILSRLVASLYLPLASVLLVPAVYRMMPGKRPSKTVNPPPLEETAP